MIWIKDCLKYKGSSPRQFLNTLLFLAPDKKNLDNLLISLAEKKAWQTIKDEKLRLNLTASQEIQADIKIDNAINTINLRIPETWSHLISPHQEKPGLGECVFEEKQINTVMDLLPRELLQYTGRILYQELGQ